MERGKREREKGEKGKREKGRKGEREKGRQSGNGKTIEITGILNIGDKIPLFDLSFRAILNLSYGLDASRRALCDGLNRSRIEKVVFGRKIEKSRNWAFSAQFFDF